MSFFGRVGNFFGGLGSKVSSAVSGLGSKISSGISSIASKTPGLIEGAEHVLHVAKQVTDSPLGQVLVNTVPFGSQIKQGINFADNAINSAKQVNEFIQTTNKAIQGNAPTLQKASDVSTSFGQTLSNIQPSVNAMSNMVTRNPKLKGKGLLERQTV